MSSTKMQKLDELRGTLMTQALSNKKTYKWPETLGAKVDRLAALDAKRDVLMAQVKLIEEEYRALENHLIDSIPKADLRGASGRTASVALNPQTVPTAKDWPAIYAYIKRYNAFELLHKRLSSEACRERWDAKKAIPGVEPFVVLKLKLTALKKRAA